VVAFTKTLPSITSGVVSEALAALPTGESVANFNEQKLLRPLWGNTPDGHELGWPRTNCGIASSVRRHLRTTAVENSCTKKNLIVLGLETEKRDDREREVSTRT
jgi:hypothetical protein